jgi:hypothetical protein
MLPAHFRHRETPMSAAIQLPRLSSDRAFYSGMGLLAALIVAVGFGPTFYLRPATLPALSSLLVIHGMVLSSWFALFIVQTGLIAANRRDIHRKLGILGTCIAAGVLVLGTMAAIESMRLGHAPVVGLDPRSFFALPMRAMVTFAILVGAAIAYRRNAETHKRLILLASFTLLDAALGRWPIPAIATYGPPVFWSILDLLIIGMLVRDWRRNGRVHKAFKWGAALIFLSEPLTLAISGTKLWLGFADGLLR